MNVLVIDDEKEIREMVSKTLEKAGYNVTASDNMADAQKLIKSQQWNLVISDIMVPHLGGFELADFIKENSNTPVILMTGMDKEVLEATRSSADFILTKPFTSKELIEAIRKEITQA